MQGVIRLFVGCASGEDAESLMVLEHTLRKHTQRDISINWMRQGLGFWQNWNTVRWATPFTGFRWGVPAFCGYEGKAIYCDSDVIFRADIGELWDQEIPGVVLLRGTEGKLRTCVMMFDCAKARDHIPPISQLMQYPDPNGWMRKYFADHRELLAPFAGNWNCIDLKGCADINDPDIKLIHYSQMSAQPHLKYAIPRLAKEGRKHWYDGEIVKHWRPELIELFDREYAEAMALGYTPERYAAPAVVYKKKSWKHYVPREDRRG